MAVGAPYHQGFHTAFLFDGERRLMCAQDVGGPAHKAPGKVGKPQMAVEFEGQSHQRLGPAAMLFGLMEIARHLKRDGDLRRQGSGPTNLLLRDARLIHAVQHTEHSQHLALGIEQRDGQQLPYIESRQDFLVHPRDFAGLVRPENFLFE